MRELVICGLFGHSKRRYEVPSRERTVSDATQSCTQLRDVTVHEALKQHLGSRTTVYKSKNNLSFGRTMPDHASFALVPSGEIAVRG